MRAAAAIAAGALLLAPATLWAQQRGPGQRGAAHVSARAEAPFDPTGYWVSLVTHDWVFRMTVPQRGQYTDIPISVAGRQFADAWNPATDEAAGKQCEAYGAAVIMQVPGRLHISWLDDDTLRVDTDAGMQTRLLHFEHATGPQDPPASWQGVSMAHWMLFRLPAARGAAAQDQARGPHYGWLQVATTDMLPGLLRKNGLPYSAQARLNENWVLNQDAADGTRYLTVTTVVNDPVYLSAPLVQNAIFKQEADGSKWDPTACSLRW
jgi:hypothetical protein